MSGFLGVCKAASIELLSDGATYDDEGVVRQIGSKVETLGDQPAVIIGRGHLQVARGFAEMVRGERLTFDQVIANYDPLMREVLAIGVRYLGEAFANHEILIAGWSSDRRRFEAYFEAMHGAWDEADGCLRPAGLAFWAGPPCEAQARFVDRFADVASIEAFDPNRDGVDALEAMRQEAVALDPINPDALVGHGVGGFVEHVTVTRTGVDRRIIRVWPDEIGRRIFPIAPASHGAVREHAG